MTMLRPSWEFSAATAAVLATLWVIARRSGRPRAGTVGAFAGEFTLVMLLLGIWQYVGRFVHTRAAGAFERAHAIARWQHAWHLPGEASIQRWVLPHPWLVHTVDRYYAYAHLNGMAVFLVWIWIRHRAAFRSARTTVALVTLACLLIQVVPVAPPRLLPDLGFVDTALAGGESVYGPFGEGIANQLSAMPSVHVAWAASVAWYAARCAPVRWRWMGPAHLLLTCLVVVATANHWWLDGVVAVAITALALLLQRLTAQTEPRGTTHSTGWPVTEAIRS